MLSGLLIIELFSQNFFIILFIMAINMLKIVVFLTEILLLAALRKVLINVVILCVLYNGVEGKLSL